MRQSIRDLVLPLKTTKVIASKLAALMRAEALPSFHLGHGIVYSHRASFCAHLQGDPGVNLAPVLVRGLYQAAFESNPDFRYWIDDSGCLLLINIMDVEFSFDDRHKKHSNIIPIRPALPIITDYLFNCPLNQFAESWGGYADPHAPFLCQSGSIGFHLGGLTASGTLFLTPNIAPLMHCHTGSPDCYERHVVEADLSSGKLIYWTQTVSKKGGPGLLRYQYIPFGSEAHTYLVPEVRDCLKTKNLTFEGIIAEFAHKSLFPSPLAPLTPIARCIEHLRSQVDLNGLNAITYDRWQHLLFELLSLLQQLPVTCLNQTSFNSHFAFEAIPGAINECIKLMFSETLDISKLGESAIREIKKLDRSINVNAPFHSIQRQSIAANA